MSLGVFATDPTSVLAALLANPARGAGLMTAAHGPLYGAQGVMTALSAQARLHGRCGFEVMQAALVDGYDVVAAQQMWGLFSPARNRAATAWALERLRAVDALRMVAGAVKAARRVLGVEAEPSPEVLLVPADPSNHNLMVANAGISAFGGLRGVTMLQVWPSAGNLQRLPGCVARVVTHGAYWRSSDPWSAPTLGDFVWLEALAGEVMAAVCPGIGVEAALAPPSDWPAALQHVAALCGRGDYAEVAGNLYGGRTEACAISPLRADALPVEEARDASGRIARALHLDDPLRVAAHLYGDAAVALHGHPSVGAPPLAAFRAGQTWLRHHRRRNPGLSLAQGLSMMSEGLLAARG